MAGRDKGRRKGYSRHDQDLPVDIPEEEDREVLPSASFRPRTEESPDKVTKAILSSLRTISEKMDTLTRTTQEMKRGMDTLGIELRDQEETVRIIHNWILELKSARTRERPEQSGTTLGVGRLT